MTTRARACDGCLTLEACFAAQKEDSGCPFECDGCGDVDEDLNDYGLCKECAGPE